MRTLSFPQVAILTAAALYGLQGRADEGTELFEKRVRPVLVRHCYSCHSTAASEPKGGLLLDSRDGARGGGDSGPAIIPGDPEKSLILSALRHNSFEMPPDRRLPKSVIDDFERWINLGAPDPRDGPPDPERVSEAVREAEYAERARHWSYQPAVDHEIPAVANPAWSAQPIDRFVLSQLQKNGLQPAPVADKTTLVRRVTFALTGLPPKPDEVETYLNDSSEDAWSALIDRLLDSRHFGERWARHWMDVVRYTDTYGYEWDVPARGAWRYRDYLIRAFNADVPFDQLVREQIAGDLLERPRINHAEGINESLIGPMFFQMGEKRHGDSASFNGIHQEMLDNKIDAFSKAFQATTVSCARCHDHKLDPIAQSEYYALAGIFMSSRWVNNTVDTPERNAKALEQLSTIKSELRPLLAELWKADASGFARSLLATASVRTGQAADEQDVASNRWWKPTSDAYEKAPPVEHTLHPWIRLLKSTADGKPVDGVWRELAAAYREERTKRKADNAAYFVPVVDFRDGVPDGWSVDGTGLTDLVRCGDFTVALDGDAAIGRVLPGGLFTDVLSPKLNGAVRTPYLLGLELEHGHISFECCGDDFSAVRSVIDNAFLTERQKYLSNTHPAWSLLSTYKSPSERRVYIEFATKTSNPNFPPRVGLGGKCSNEQIADPLSWFGLTRAVLHNAPRTPADELDRFDPLFSGAAPATLEEAAVRYATWFRAAVDNWAEDSASQGDVRLLNWLLDNHILRNRHGVDADPRLAQAVDRYRSIEQTVLAPQTVNGMADLDAGYDYRLNIRGDYGQLGDPVPRGYMRLIANVVTSRESPDHQAAGHIESTRSGRLELAELIASERNPLTARVFVNRVWAWLFGTGMVATPSDFGHLGDRPSHPELLDWLTHRFVQNGWRTKPLIREILKTKTWQQSGQVSEHAAAIDPRNRLLHHFPMRRLEAESIRDAILAVSGRLQSTRFGPPVDPPRANEDPQKRLFSGPQDGNGRRSIYTKITIMEPPRFLALFNQPTPKIPTGRRDITSTPAQSLALLNDAFVIEQAKYWAQQLATCRTDSVDERIQKQFVVAFGRTATQRERQRWRDAVTDLAALHDLASADEDDVLRSVDVWQDVAHAIFNTREFIYVR